MILNSLVAACLAHLFPILLDKFKWDPATGSGVIVTMITDILGFSHFGHRNAWTKIAEWLTLK